MSWAFAVGAAIGAAVVVFGRETAAGVRLLTWLHVRLALLRRGGGR
jgi:hypothetical protein